jgi:hypothetical protein
LSSSSFCFFTRHHQHHQKPNLSPKQMFSLVYPRFGLVGFGENFDWEMGKLSLKLVMGRAVFEGNEEW